MTVVQQKQTPAEKQHILRTLPPETVRVQVIENGKTRFKFPADILDDDQIVLKTNGEAVVTQGQSGRKTKVPLPVDPQVALVLDAKHDHLGNSALLSATKNSPEGDDVLNQIVMAMAEEAASLDFEKKEAERLGKDTSGFSSKRARVLKGMADTWLKRKEKIESSALDLESPSFRILMEFILETIRGAMEDAGLRSEHIETVMNKSAKRFKEGWNEEAKARMREGK